MKTLFSFILILSAGLASPCVEASEPELQASVGMGFGISSAATGENVLFVQAARLHPVFEGVGRFQLGYGVRASSLKADQIGGQAYQVTAVNAAIHAAYQGLGIVDIGMNLDVIGASFGSDVGHRLNLVRGGKSDFGFLNSEFYVMSRLFDTAFARLSFMHVASGASPQAFVDCVGVSVGLVW